MVRGAGAVLPAETLVPVRRVVRVTDWTPDGAGVLVSRARRGHARRPVAGADPRRRGAARVGGDAVLRRAGSDLAGWTLDRLCVRRVRGSSRCMSRHSWIAPLGPAHANACRAEGVAIHGGAAPARSCSSAADRRSTLPRRQLEGDRTPWPRRPCCLGRRTPPKSFDAAPDGRFLLILPVACRPRRPPAHGLADRRLPTMQPPKLTTTGP